MTAWWTTGALEGWLTVMGRVSFHGGVLILGVWCMTRLLRRLPAPVRSWFWRLVWLKLALLLVWPAAVEVPLLPQPPARLQAALGRTEPPGSPGTAHWVTSQPMAPASLATGVPAVDSGSGVWLPVAVLFVIWLGGVVFLGVRLRGRVQATASLRRGAHSVTDPWMARDYVALRSRLVPRRSVPLLRHAGVAAPQTLGVLRPVILVPERFPDRASVGDARMILAHELAHIRHGDVAWRWFRQVIRTMLFFHPLIWLADRETTLAEELACDERALGVTRAKPAEYADLLLRAASPGLAPGGFPGAEMSPAGRQMYHRIQALAHVMERAGASDRMPRRPAAWCGVFVLCLLLPWGFVTGPHAPGVRQFDPAHRVLDYQVSRGTDHALRVRRERCQWAGLSLMRSEAVVAPADAASSRTVWGSDDLSDGFPIRVGGWLRALGLRPDMDVDGCGLTLHFQADTWVFLVRFASVAGEATPRELDALLVDDQGEAIELAPHPLSLPVLAGEDVACWVLAPAPIGRARFDLLLRSRDDGKRIAQLRLGAM
jgi:beta-lactamase regulating signal transducer with metallopeptidase domain